MPQGHVSQFELAKMKMSWDLAERVAPAYYSDEWQVNQHYAKLLSWRLWFANVAAYGQEAMKRVARELKDRVERDIITAEEEAPLLAGIVNDKPAEIIPMPFAAQKKAGHA